jgi:hypothetical protein
MDIALATSVADHFHFATEVRPVRIGVWHRTGVVDLHDNEQILIWAASVRFGFWRAAGFPNRHFRSIFISQIGVFRAIECRIDK